MKMRIAKYVKPPLFIIMSMAFACQSAVSTNAPSITTVYEESGENFSNPERGFYAPVDPIGEQAGSPLNASKMENLRSQNITLVRRIYQIEEFRDKPISESFLNMISNDCETARQTGVKLIIRFSYNWLGRGPDAPKDRILSHIEQLKPIFAANYDVIAYQEVGFIGNWGQWVNSSNNLIDNATFGVTKDSKAIFFKILSVFPTERMVALTNPKQKKQMFNTTTPLTATEAFNGTPKARTGSYNDAFLIGPDDGGYYTADKVEEDKKFLSQDHLYVVQGGEAAGDPPEAEPYLSCSNALKDLARMRWSALNSFNVGFGDGWAVIKRWEKEGCVPEIERHLGYRFRLVKSSIPERIEPAGTFSMKFEIVNDGWASPYNPRGLEVILRNSQTGNEYYLPVQNDPRKWMPGATKVVEIVGGIPTSMPPGEYQVLLNLPDPTPRLYNRPQYSIRLANKNIWETSTGYNSLLRNVTVDANAGGEKYSGKDFFKSR